MNGLRGEAGGSGGIIRVTELYNYVEERLASEKAKQHPFFKAAFEKDYAIARHLGGKSGWGVAIASALEVLSRLIDEKPDVRQMVSAIKNKLEAERAQVKNVAFLKSLHDRLHDLQAYDFPEILREQELLPSVARAWPNLTNMSDWVKTRAEMLRPFAITVYPEKGAAEWVDELVSAAELLHQGALHRNADEVEDGILRFNRVLSTRPAQVNTDLLAAIRRMKLRELFGELMRIGEEMVRLEVAESDVRTFTAGGQDLGRLDREIADLMDQHVCWQDIDVEARRIDNNWKGHPRELNASWPSI